MRHRLTISLVSLLLVLLSFVSTIQAAAPFSRTNARNWAYANINSYNGTCLNYIRPLPCQCTQFVSGALAAGGMSGPNFAWIGNQYLVKWMWEHPDQWAFIDPHNTEPGDFILYSIFSGTNRRNWSQTDPSMSSKESNYKDGASVGFAGYSRFGHTALVVENGGIVADWNNGANNWTARFDDRNSGYNFATILGIHVRDSNPSSFNAYSQIKGSNFSASYDTQLETTSDAGGGLSVGYISSGSYLRFDNVVLGSTGPISVQMRSAGYNSSGQINFRIGSPTAAPFATLTPSNTNGWQTWVTQTANTTTRPTGTQTVYVTFENDPHVNINWFQFVQGNTLPVPPQITYPSNNAIVTERPSGDLGVRMFLNVQLQGTGTYAVQLSNGTGQPFYDMYPTGGAGVWGTSPMRIGIPMSTDGTYSLRAKNKNSAGESTWSQPVTFRVVKVATPTPTPIPTRVPPTATPQPTINPCVTPENRGGMAYGITYELPASCKTRVFTFVAGTGPVMIDAQPRGVTGWQYQMDLYNASGIRLASAHSSIDSRAILTGNIPAGSYRLNIVPLSGQGAIGVALYSGYGSLSFSWMQSAYYDMTYWRYYRGATSPYYLKIGRTNGNLEYSVRVTNANGQQVASGSSRNGNINLQISGTSVGWYNVYITVRSGTYGSYSAGLANGSAPAY